MNLLWVLLPVTLVLWAAEAARRRRRQLLLEIRAAWGTPVARVHRMDAILMSHRARVAAFATSSLDERTWVDLNLDQVFATLDRTQSTLGQHALYHRLRTAPVADHLAPFEALVDRMSRDEAGRQRAQLALARLQDPHGYDIWWLANTHAVSRRSWYAVFPLLTTTTLALAALAPFSSAALTLLIAVLVLNVVVRYATDERVGALARSFRQCAPLIATAESLRFVAGPDIDPIVGPLRTDVPSLARLKLISRWVNGDPFMLSVGASPPPVALLSDFVRAAYEYLNLALLLDATGVYFGVRDLAQGGGALVRAAAAAGEVDAAISIASYRASLSHWTRPDFRTGPSAMDFLELRHPLLGDAVPNSIAMAPGRGVLVTGSNMSGKSTFLRTVGVNVILAQTVHTCLAREYHAPMLVVRSCIGRADDLVAGKSYYIAEVEALLGLVRASGERAPHLFLLDELFRGTNAVERIAAGQAVLQELLRDGHTRKSHVVVAATHDRELVDLSSDLFDPYHFGDSIGPEGLLFDHRIQPGPATTRNALALLLLHGAPHTLLTRAAATAEALDRQLATGIVAR